MSITETEVAVESTPDGASVETEPEVFQAEFDESPEPVDALFEVDGTPITVDEAKNGYLRQADYTRKTQELAEQRRQLQNAEVLQAALQRDPQATIKALADAYGVGFNAQSPAPPSAPSGGDDLWGDELSSEPTDGPVHDPRLDELVQWRQQQEVAAAQAQIQNELATLEGEYGSFDHAEVMRFALDNGFPDVTSAFKAMNFDRVQSELARRSEETKRLQAKREAQVVSQGASRPGAAAAQTPEGGMSIREAWLAAKKQFGG